MIGVEDVLENFENWHHVGTSYYAQKELYPIDWQAKGDNLAFMRVYGGASGAPIAAFRDESKVVLYAGSFTRPDVQIYTAAGHSLGRVLWDKGRIMHAGWTPKEQLVVVDETGQVYVYGVRGGPHTHQMSLGTECEQEGVADVVVYPGGVVAMTTLRHLWSIPNIEDPRVQRLASPCASHCEVHCMAVIPPSTSASGSLEVVVAVDRTLRLVDSNDSQPTTVAEGPVVKLGVSPDGKMVAGYSQDGVVHVWTADLADVVTRVGVHETGDSFEEEGLGADGVPQTPPDKLAWCGSNAVVLFWEGVGLLLVSVGGEWKWWACDASASFVTEVDGVRIVHNRGMDLLRKVPDPLVSVLEIGSTSPGALLYDARRLFDAQDAKATAELLEILRSGDLPSAVATCLRASTAELDPHKQEALMKASCYGRAFCMLAPEGSPQLPTDPRSRMETVEAARKLRVVNNLREPDIGIPLTVPQLEAEGMTGVVTRLVGRGHYLLAFRICEALRMPTEQVLVRWACDKVTASASSLDDSQLLEALEGKLRGQPGVKWSRVAAHAQSVGRRQLAALLLDHETNAGDQVPLLLELGEEDRALDRAVESGDSDLVFEVVHHLWKRVERGSTQAGGVSGGVYDAGRTTPASQRFWAAVGRRPSALAFFVRYHRNTSPALLLELYEGLGRHDAAAELHLALALDMAAGGEYTETQVQRQLALAKGEYTKAGAADKAKDLRWEAGSLVLLARLREVQLELQDSTRREGFVGLSVADTIRQCLRLGLKDQAAKIGRDFKVPDKQFLLLQVWGLAGRHDWPALQHMAGKLDRRAPIAAEHVVTAARSNGAPPEVLRWLIERVGGENVLLKQAQLFSEVGLHQDARRAAEQAEQVGAAGGVAAGMLGSLRGAVGGGGGRGVLGNILGRVTSGGGGGS